MVKSMKHLLTLVIFAWAQNTLHAAKPNFVFLLGDDINRDSLGCYGNVDCPTPHIDKLVKDGVKFNKAYTFGGHVRPI